MKLLKHFASTKQDLLNKENEIDNQKMNNFLNKSTSFLSSNDMKIGDTKTFTKNDILFTQFMTSEGLFEKSSFTKNNYLCITYEGFIKNTKSFKEKTYLNITIHERTYSPTIKIKEVVALIKSENKDFEHLKHFSHIMKAKDNDNKIYEMIDEIEEFLTYQKHLQKQNILSSFKFNDNKQVNQEIENIENALSN